MDTRTPRRNGLADVSGLWVQSDADSTDNVLRVAGVEYDVGQCRNATVHSLGATPFADERVADAIWADLVEWSDDHLEGSAAHGLEFTRRGGGDSTELFVISQRDELLGYLEARLPTVAKACEESDEEGRTEWVTYIRLTAPRQPNAADAADTSPSPPN